MGFFKKRKKNKTPIEQRVTPLKPLNYNAKTILGWSEAIAGNTKIRDWFAENGFEELSVFCYALLLKDDARDWLMTNGYAHLMACIHAVEEDKAALEWLDRYEFHTLKNIALAGRGEKEGYQWIKENLSVEYFILAQKIQEIKDEIELNHNDIHKFGKD